MSTAHSAPPDPEAQETLWRIELFGGPRAVRGEQVVSRFRTAKTGALLAYLALHMGRIHPRDALVELFWGEDALEQGRRSLRTALSSLRHQLEPPGVPAGSVLVADRSSVSLSSDAVVTDVVLFEQSLRRAERASGAAARIRHLEEAVARYSGPLLPGCYEDWALSAQERLRERCGEALRQLLTDLQSLGDVETALRYARRAVAADPLDEASRRELMRLLGSRGDGEAALREYAELERRLSEELDATPSAATRAVVRELRSRAAEPSPVPEPSASTRPPFPGQGTAAPAEWSAPEELPRGTVTFLLVETPSTSKPETSRDVEWEARRRGGVVVREVDGLTLGAFGRAADAAACAVQLLTSTPELRFALDTGDVTLLKGEYEGPVLRRVRDLLHATHPGQALCSEATAALLRSDSGAAHTLEDLGLYRLGDPPAPTRLLHLHPPQGERRAFPPPSAPRAHPTNLPPTLTRFFGREGELARLLELLTLSDAAYAPRILTLTGPGGTGKTRLAVETAWRLLPAYHGAVWFVPLADVGDPRLVPNAIASALGVKRTNKAEAVDDIAAALGHERVLLVLDNFEQVAGGAAPYLRSLLGRAPGARLLVTSRRSLALEGERLVPVEPLPSPPLAAGPPPTALPGRIASQEVPHVLSPAELLRWESVQLFVDRAQALRPDFQVTPANAAAVARLAGLLEGIPLAIELAAARIGVHTPAQMVERLARRFELVQSARTDREERHRSLWAAVAWSYDLLPSHLQRFFARLSVFRGGWSAAAAAEVSDFRFQIPEDGPPATDSSHLKSEILHSEILEWLSQLRQYSLVLTEDGGEQVRFRMLETLREFAAEQLGPEERATLARAHAGYFRAFTEQSRERHDGSGLWMRRLEEEHENLRAAIQWSLDHDEVETALCFGGALAYFWVSRDRIAEGRSWLDRILALAARRTPPAGEDPVLGPLLAAAHDGAGELAYRVGDLEPARVHAEKAVETARAHGQKSRAAHALQSLGNCHFRSGQYAQAGPYYEEALALYRELGEEGHVLTCLTNLGHVASNQQDLERGRRLLEESLAIQRTRRDLRGMLSSLLPLGALEYGVGDHDRAAEIFHESLALSREYGYGVLVAYALTGLGNVAFRRGQPDEAREYYAEAVRIHAAAGAAVDVAYVLVFTARVEFQEGNLALAREYALGALVRHQGFPGHPCAADCLIELSRLALAEGEPRRAARLAGAAETIRSRAGAPLVPIEQADFRAHLQAVEARLNPAACERELAAGRALEPFEAVTWALSAY